jgi:hypothetical protein
VGLAGSPLKEQERYGSSDVTAYVQPGCFHHVWAAPKRLELMRTIYNWAWSRAKYHNLRAWRQRKTSDPSESGRLR